MPDTPYDIEFDENVAEDNLSIHKLDPALMALEAIAMYPDNSMFKATIRRDPKDTSKFQVINETKISKNQLKNTLLSEFSYFPKCAPQGLRRKVHRNRLPLQASESFHLHRWYFFAW